MRRERNGETFVAVPILASEYAYTRFRRFVCAWGILEQHSLFVGLVVSTTSGERAHPSLPIARSNVRLQERMRSGEPSLDDHLDRYDRPSDTEHKLFCDCLLKPCPCALTIGGKSAPPPFPMNVCLPKELNTAIGDKSAIDALSESDYENKVIEYCSGTVQQWVDILIPNAVGKGGGAWCHPNTCRDLVNANGGGFLIDSECAHEDVDNEPAYIVACGTVAADSNGHATAPNPQNCDQPPPSAPTPCYATTDAGAPVCDPNQVFDQTTNTVHPDLCMCDESANACHNVLTTSQQIVRPMATNGDPPTGLVSGMLSQASPVSLDKTQSTLTVTVNITDAADSSHSDTETVPVSGIVTFYGRPCPSAECDLALDLDLFPTNMTFHFSNVTTGFSPCADPLTFFICPDVQDVAVSVSDITLGAGTGATRVHIDSSGNGRIPIASLPIHAEGVIAGVPNQGDTRDIFDDTNAQELDFHVDFASKTFSVSNFPFNFDGGLAHLTLSGTITNQPPVAVAGPDQIVECTSSSGADVTLDGTGTTDADDNLWSFFSYAWWKETPLVASAGVASGATAHVAAPFGTTRYWLTATDSFLSITSSQKPTMVTVQDTTPPDLHCPANQVLECTAGGATASYSATATDLCGPATVSCVPPSGTTFPVGSTSATCTATDAHNNQSSCTFSVEVRDTLPPTVTTKSDANGFCATLWPPSHGYQPFSLSDCITSVVDQCDGPLSIDQAGRVIRITSDEPDNSSGSGNTCNDAVISTPTTFAVRSERDGGGDGRVYTVFVGVSDHAGNEVIVPVKIGVPHDQSGTPAIDSGPHYCLGQGCGTIPGSNCQ